MNLGYNGQLNLANWIFVTLCFSNFQVALMCIVERLIIFSILSELSVSDLQGAFT